MTSTLPRITCALAALLAAGSCGAWGPDGHHTVGALADRLIAGTRAAREVHALLGDLSLENAAVWADCAKGVDPKKGYAYTSAGKYAECAIFETPDGEAAMIDFVRRNDTNCPRAPGDESCHAQYHYTDEAIQRNRYARGTVGTRDFDVVAAVAAATHVLRGDPAPAPFDIKDKREALLLLAHDVGDIHQPLHVGAVYLDASGKRVDPDAGAYDPATATRGGNQLVTILEATNFRSANLHQTWDDIPARLDADHIDRTWIAQARTIARTHGDPVGWSTAWADDTLDAAHGAFARLEFGPEAGGAWTVPVNCRYDDAMTKAKQRQLTKAGARLAQLLQAIWPG